jgi:ribose 5-phosphate isomerase B
MTETIAIASDHAGFALKGVLKLELETLGYAPLDLGTHDTASVDYPDYADKLAQAIKAGKAARGVLVCGTGIGISIAANRHREIRAALCQDATTARLSREHNDANVLVLGGRIVGEEVARECLKAFLATAFAGRRHEGRVAKLAKP